MTCRGWALPIAMALTGCGSGAPDLVGSWERGPVVIASQRVEPAPAVACDSTRDRFTFEDDGRFEFLRTGKPTDAPECSSTFVVLEETLSGTWLLSFSDEDGLEPVLLLLPDAWSATVDEVTEVVQYRDEDSIELVENRVQMGREDGARWLWIDDSGRWQEVDR